MLSLILWLPFVFAILCLATPEKWLRPVATVFALIELAITIKLFCVFDVNVETLQLVEKTSWIPQYGIQYLLGIDGISLWLVVLTNFLAPIVVVGSWSAITEKSKMFHASLFLLQTAMLGTFLSLDLILFYLFWELSLVPMYFLIGIWGGPKRIYATVKFFLFTMFGSVLMLVAMMALIYMSKQQFGSYTTDVTQLYKLTIPFVAGQFLSPQTLMFFAFTLAFAIKVPMFPVHTWLPDAHTEAPTPGSVILAGVMLKMGGYGLIRFSIPLFHDAALYYADVMMWLAAIGLIYGALVAMVQPDIKKLVAYSSVSHMGAVVLGIFTLNHYGVAGSIYQMLNHGISTGALFLLVGMIYERTHSREIKKYGGLALAMPIYTICFVIITMSSIAVPGTNGFIGEFLILLGAFQARPWIGVVSVTGVIFGAAYMLWMVKRVFFGPAGEIVNHSLHEKDDHHRLHDLNKRELGIMVVLIAMVFWMGVNPNFFMRWSNTSVEHFVKNYQAYSLTK